MDATFDQNYIEIIDAGIDEALANGDILVYLQPQYNSVSGEIIGAECLSRWKHKTEGFLNPAQFIPILEELGKIYELDHFVWETACGLISKWKKMGHTLSLSVNVSRKDIEQDDLPTVFSELVKRYDIEPSLLRLEITESVYMANPEQLIELVNRLVKLGFNVEMDDFGSGFSSLNLLHDLYVDVLKLDMGFLKETDENKRSGNIINAVVKMAHTLDMKVIAEGVENSAQAEFLKNIGCLMAQGFFFSKPMPIEEFEQLLLNSYIYDMRYHNRADALFNVEELFDRTSSGYFIFNHCMGSAALFEYDGKNLQPVVANDRFVEVIECDREQLEHHRANVFNAFSEATRKNLRRLVEQARVEGTSSGEIFSGRMKKYVSVKLRYMERHDCADLFFCEATDITEEVKMRRKMERLQRDQMEKRRYEKKLQVILEVPGIVLYEYDPDLDEMIVSVRAENGEYHERTATHYIEKLRERNWVHPDDIDRYVAAIKSIKAPNDYASVNVRAITQGGVFCHAKYHFTSFCDDAGKVVKIMGRAEMLDIDSHDAYMDNLPVGTLRYVADDSQEFEYIGKGAMRLLGFTNEEKFREAYKNSFANLVYEEDRERVLTERAEQIKNGQNYYCEYRIVDAAHNIRWVYDAGVLTIDEHGVKKYNVALSDMNRYKEEALRREKRIEEEVAAYKEDSTKDLMTGLLNHSAVLTKIQEMMNNGEKGIFAILDIDNFKAINDTHGHVFGDQAICSLAEGMKRLFRGCDVVGRYGGDEFVFFVAGTTSKNIATRKAEGILSMAATIPTLVGEFMSLSIGIVNDSSKAKDVKELVAMADSVLYSVKKAGKGTYGFYENGK